MRYIQTPLPGAWIIEHERISDDRGWFARTFDADEFSARGMNHEIAQCNCSFNARRDTLRGMHYQADPHGESKVVRCVRGVIFDVALDLRPDSPAFRSWHGVELSAENRRAFYLPAGVAHGFQTLSENCEIDYLMGARHVPAAARGVRYDDRAFAIRWPQPHGDRTISERDRSYPDFQP